jgi:hypothetical protein
MKGRAQTESTAEENIWTEEEINNRRTEKTTQLEFHNLYSSPMIKPKRMMGRGSRSQGEDKERI